MANSWMQIFESFCYAIGVCASLHHAHFCTEEEFGNDSKQVWRKHSSSVVILSVQQFVASRVNV